MKDINELTQQLAMLDEQRENVEKQIKQVQEQALQAIIQEIIELLDKNNVSLLIDGTVEFISGSSSVEFYKEYGTLKDLYKAVGN
jgi:glutamate synthase domain-containing protein 1